MDGAEHWRHQSDKAPEASRDDYSRHPSIVAPRFSIDQSVPATLKHVSTSYLKRQKFMRMSLRRPADECVL